MFFGMIYNSVKEIHYNYKKQEMENTSELDKAINQVATKLVNNPHSTAIEKPQNVANNMKVGFTSTLKGNKREIIGSLPPDGFEGLDVTKLKFGKSLGNGCNGAVTIVTFDDGKEYVQKSPIVVDLEGDVHILGLDSLESEAKITKILSLENSPNIIKYIGSTDYKQKVSESNGQTVRLGCLVLEKAKGDLTHYLNEKHPLEHKKILKFSSDLASGLKILEKHNIVHLDLKSDNLLIGEDGNLKIGDFGESHFSAFGNQIQKLGSPFYLSPECKQFPITDKISSKADIWSAGLNMINFAIGNENFDPFLEALGGLGKNPDKSAIGNLIDQTFINQNKTEELTDFISLIKLTLDPDPDSRMDANELKKRLELLKYQNSNPEDNLTDQKITKAFLTRESTI